jgi:uncharacterized protein (DUF362 family)
MKHKVLIMRCDDYDPNKIGGIIKEGMEELGVRPKGRTILKPNTVMADQEVFPHAFTRKEFIEGVIIAAKDKGDNDTELFLGERSGITVPTRLCFKRAGYLEVTKRHRVKPSYFDEVRQVPVRLRRPESLRDLIYVPEPIVQCDFLINMPKFKAHPWTRLTLSLKNYIGIQDDRHRLLDHNSFLEHKIADLQEVIQPGFIAIDAITAGQKTMLTPIPFPMGAIVMGVNPCAVDTVGCHMVNVDPRDLIHLRYTAERGFGPIDLDEIEVAGDFPLEEVQHRNKDFEFMLERVDDYFEPTRSINCTVGRFPEEHSTDYCWGGCPGALQESWHIITGVHPDADKRMKKIRYVVGEVKEPINAAPDETILFVGDCCKYKGPVNGEQVNIDGDYKGPAEFHATRTKSNDMIRKILSSLLHCFIKRSARSVHAKGCPVSVAAHVNYLSSFGKIPNVNFDRRFLVSINIDYWRMRIMRLYHSLFD